MWQQNKLGKTSSEAYKGFFKKTFKLLYRVVVKIVKKIVILVTEKTWLAYIMFIIEYVFYI